MIDSTKTMYDLCDDEPLLEGFLQAKGFPFSRDNPITQYVTFDDVCNLRQLDRGAFLAEFEDYKLWV